MALPTQTIEFKAGKDTYNFPTPSPRLPPPRGATTQASPARSPLHGTAAIGESPKIGVAIGSPREMPPQWGRTHTVDQVSKKLPARPPPTRAMTELPHVPEKTPEPLPKKKASWKNLGGIFGRKPSTKTVAPEPFYKLQPPREQEEQPAPTRVLHSAARQQVSPSPALSSGEDRSPLPAATGHRRTPSITRGIARLEARAQADRAAFMEQEGKMEQGESRVVRTPSMIMKEGFSPTFGGSPGVPRTSEDIFKSMDAAGGKRNDSPLSVNEGSGPLRLDLDIPDHHMERYSIMFEKLLGSGGDKGPSIIERRQSKLQKKRSLKRLDEGNAKLQADTPPLQRSATSPHLSTMPTLSITTGKKVRSPAGSPGAPDAAPADPPVTAVHRARPVKRSNTAPTQTASPVRQNFSKPRMVMITAPAADDQAEPAPAHVRGLSMYSENSLPPTPTSEQASMDERGAIPPPPPIAKHAADDSQTWEMLTANPNTSAIPKRQASLRRQEPNPYSRVKSPEDLEGKVVQVSVARQVSVSKARNQVRQATESKQPLRPRVVELCKHRKSTMVLIEGADE